jgi:hypothetical protein
MIRRPLWNRGGGVFVEEASWNVPHVRRPAADLPAPPQPAPSARTARPADRPAEGAPATPAGERPGRSDGERPPAMRLRPKRPARPDALRARPTWLGVVTVREDD